jgi:hypothetical protein
VIRRIINLSAAFLATVLMLGLTASMASAAVADLQIGTIGYNAVGADTALNRNAEYVDIKNTSAAAVNVHDLVIEDAWRHGQPDSYRGHCNRFTIDTIPVASGANAQELPAGDTLRVYFGSGNAKVFGDGHFHAVYMNSNPHCGYNGHVLNNNPPSNRYAPWDTVWVGQGGQWKSKSYSFRFGFYVS